MLAMHGVWGWQVSLPLTCQPVSPACPIQQPMVNALSHIQDKWEALILWSHISLVTTCYNPTSAVRTMADLGFRSALCAQWMKCGIWRVCCESFVAVAARLLLKMGTFLHSLMWETWSSTSPDKDLCTYLHCGTCLCMYVCMLYVCSMYAQCLTCCDLSNLLCPFQSETLAYNPTSSWYVCTCVLVCLLLSSKQVVLLNLVATVSTGRESCCVCTYVHVQYLFLYGCHVNSIA